MAEYFPGGGTDFQSPIDAAIELLEDKKLKRGDIVVITDGECQVTPGMAQRTARAQERGFEFLDFRGAGRRRIERSLDAGAVQRSRHLGEEAQRRRFARYFPEDLGLIFARAARSKKLAQRSRAFFGKDTAVNLDPMVQAPSRPMS